jgi:hypothetical protein
MQRFDLIIAPPDITEQALEDSPLWDLLVLVEVLEVAMVAVAAVVAAEVETEVEEEEAEEEEVARNVRLYFEHP